MASTGGHDLQSLVNSEKKHRRVVWREASSSKLTNFLIKSGSKVDEVSAGERIFAFHSVKHHNSYKATELHIRFTGNHISRFCCWYKIIMYKNKDRSNSKLCLGTPFCGKYIEKYRQNLIIYWVVSIGGSNHASVKLFLVVLLYLIGKVVVWNQN